MSCVMVPSSLSWMREPFRPGVLGGGVDSTAGELVLEGDDDPGEAVEGHDAFVV